jgi:hypothetical protein
LKERKKSKEDRKKKRRKRSLFGVERGERKITDIELDTTDEEGVVAYFQGEVK